MPGEDIWSWSITASANGTADTNINWAENQARASVNDSARSMMAALAKSRDLQSGNLITSGAPNAQSFVSGVGYTVIPSGLRLLLWNGAGTNTGSVTLNMDGIGDIPVKDRLGASLIGGELPFSTYYETVYDGTNWRILTFPPPAPVLLNTTTVVDASAVNYTASIQQGFDKYVFVLRGIVPEVDGDHLYVRISLDGGASWLEDPGDYSYVLEHFLSEAPSGTYVSYGTDAAGAAFVAVDLSNVTTDSLSGEIELYAPHLTKYLQMKWVMTGWNALHQNLYTGGASGQLGPITGLQLICASGNIAEGQILLYGING